MDQQLGYLAAQVTVRAMSRREFMGRAATLGVSAAMASTVFASAAKASGPVKGGVFKVGLQGGESTDSLDPALAHSTVPFMNRGKRGSR